MGTSGARVNFLEHLDPLRPRTIGRPYSVSWEDRRGIKHITRFTDEESARGFSACLKFMGARPWTGYVPADLTEAELLE